MSIEEYNNCTPYELNVAVKVYRKRKEIESEEKLSLVWMGEYWHRLKKLPEFHKAIGKEKPKKVMTDDEMLEVVKKLNSQMGGNVNE